jgi:hypothetical protein
MVASRKKNKEHTHPKGSSSQEIAATLFVCRGIKQRALGEIRVLFFVEELC